MHHILRDRKTGVFDHAVSLGNAGEPAKRKHAQYKGRRLVSQKADPPGDFKKTACASHKSPGSLTAQMEDSGSKVREDEKEIEKDHIASQPCNTGK